MNRVVLLVVLTSSAFAQAEDWSQLDSVLDPAYRPRNVVPALEPLGEPRDLPLHVSPYDAHIRLSPDQTRSALATAGDLLDGWSNHAWFHLQTDGTWEVSLEERVGLEDEKVSPRVKGALLGGDNAAAWRKTLAPSLGRINDAVLLGAETWLATETGLFHAPSPTATPTRHPHYGIDGPPATRITALATDGSGQLWVGTPVGLGLRDAHGGWSILRGADGLPYEDITALACDPDNNLWIGTRRGVVHYRPDDPVRNWFYRAGPRYLPNDDVREIALSGDGRTVYVLTAGGPGVIRVTEKTLREKARRLEALVEQRHRRLGLVAACRFPDPSDLRQHVNPDSPNDGLWTAYHIAAMSLAFATTEDPAHRDAAREGMHALYMLQDVSGVPGLPARSVVRADRFDLSKLEGKAEWHRTADGQYYWRGDTSSDEYCGHYLAFYTYWEHVARRDPEEAARLTEQVRAMTDYLLKNNYQLIDVDGERTRWGVWNPEALNGDPDWQIENGLNALQICSFLRVTHYITGDARYHGHYLKLLQEHDYLSNILLEKKIFPDEVNHSDDQLGFCAWYPILQIEDDPRIRYCLHQAVRRHWVVEAAERPSFFTFVYGSIDPNHADLEGAIRNLQEIPEDRRDWRMENSHRSDVQRSTRLNRFDDPVITRCLPADERNFEKWNADPFEPDDGTLEGREEQTGATYLLPYWMGRYHGFFTEE